jgi:hypothetical protein
VESGWLLRDGEVLASTSQPSGWRARFVSARSFEPGVGAVLVAGPALCLGTAVARLGDASRVRTLSNSRRPHLIAPTRYGVALKSELAERVRVGDELELRRAS